MSDISRGIRVVGGIRNGYGGHSDSAEELDRINKWRGICSNGDDQGIEDGEDGGAVEI